MKQYFTLIMLLISINLHSQIENEEFNSKPITPKVILHPIIPYDSLHQLDYNPDGYVDPQGGIGQNILPSLNIIGQSIYLTPNSDVELWSGREEKIKYDLNKKIPNTSNNISNRSFKISNIYTYGTAASYHHYYTELINDATKDTVYTWKIDVNKWLSVGYYEKLKQLFVGKKIHFTRLREYEFISKNDTINDIGEDNIDGEHKDIDIGDEFLCTGIKYKKTEESVYDRYDGGLNFIFIAKNNDAEIFFSFKNLRIGTDNEYSLNKRRYDEGNEGYGNDFMFLDAYNKMKKIENKENLKKINKEKQDHLTYENNKKNIIKKYGQHYGQYINNREVIIGMNKSMCKDAWGCYKVVEQTNTDKGLIEIWKDCFSNTRIYLKNGIVYKVQTW